MVLITGGSRGIGRATAVALSQQGYSVCINYRSQKQEAQELVSEIRKCYGGNAYAVQADVSNESEVDSMFDEIDTFPGSLYGLVNNAGILGDQSTLIEMSAERIQQIFAVNVVGSFVCAREAIKRMQENNFGGGSSCGSIVNVSSGASQFGSPNEYIDYAATKGAIDTFTLGLAKEVASKGIRVNAVRPGFVDTEMHKIPNRMEQVKARIPMGRVGSPNEIAEAIVWLISEKASYTTGAILDVAGGK